MNKFLLTVSLVIAFAVQSFSQVPAIQRNAITTNVVPLVAGSGITFTPLGSNIISISSSGGGGVTLAQVTNVLNTATISNVVAGTFFSFTNPATPSGFYADGTGLFNAASQGFNLGYSTGTLTMQNGSFFGSNAFINLANGTGTHPFTLIGTVNDHQKIDNQNLSNGTHAATEFAARNDLSSGSDTNYLARFGILSSGNTDNVAGNPSDAYLLTGIYIPSLNIWATGPTNVVRFGAGGVGTNNEVFRIGPGGAVFTGTITNNTLTATSVTGADANKKEVSLTLAGGLSLTGTTLSGANITNAATLSVYASNVVSGGQLPLGTVSSSTGAAGQFLGFNGTVRTWTNITGADIASGTLSSNVLPALGYLTNNTGIGTNETFWAGTIFQQATNQPAIEVTNAWINGTVAIPVVDITGTWNNGSLSSPTAFRLNMTNTASTGTPLLMDLRANTLSEFKVSSGGSVTMNGNLSINGSTTMSAAGFGLSVKAGSNCKIGQAVLSAGTVTVANTSVTANSQIFLWGITASGTIGTYFAPTNSISAGTSFVINSVTGASVVQTLDTSTVGYMIVEKN